MKRATERMWQQGWRLLAEIASQPACDDTQRVLVRVGIDIADDSFLSGNWARFCAVTVEIEKILNTGGSHA